MNPRQEDDIATVQSWISMKRRNGLIVALPHAPYFPFRKEENYWLLLVDHVSDTAWVWKKVSFVDEATAVIASPKAIQ